MIFLSLNKSMVILADILLGFLVNYTYDVVAL